MKKVLLTMPWLPEVVTDLDRQLAMMRDHGFEVVIDPRAKRLSEEELIEAYPGIYGHVCGCDAISERVLTSSAASELKVISRIGVGYDTIDAEAAARQGIAVCNAPGVGAETVAEFAFALMISLSRQVKQADAITRSGAWGKATSYSLYRKTLGIVGFGNIGKQLARLTAGFDMKILAYDPYYQDQAFARAHQITFCDLETLLRQSDYISLHLPITPETKDLIGARELAMMKPTAQLINCARGGIVNETALYETLREHRIFGAAFDVFEQEPIQPDHPFFSLDNMLMTPHHAGTTVEGKNKIMEAAFRNVIAYAEQTGAHLVNDPVKG